jgi:hypothetical protein
MDDQEAPEVVAVTIEEKVLQGHKIIIQMDMEIMEVIPEQVQVMAVPAVAVVALVGLV